MNRTKLVLFFITMLAMSHGAKAAMSLTAATSGYMTFGNPFPSQSTFTICLWFKPFLTANQTTVELVNYRSSSLSTPVAMQFDILSAGNIRMTLRDDASHLVTCNSALPIVSTNTWCHLAVTKNGSICNVYVNGLFSTSTVTTTIGTTTPNILSVGAAFAGTPTPSSFANGVMDDPRIYNRVLSNSELLTFANCNCRPQITDGLILYPALDDGFNGTTSTGTVVLDRSGFGRNGTITCVGAGCKNPVWQASSWINYP